MKIVFHHVPRTAGTSLRRVIEANYPAKERTETYDPERAATDADWAVEYYGKLGWLKRRRTRIFLGHTAGGFIRAVKPPVMGITVLRHSVDHVLSVFHHARTHPDREDKWSLADLIQKEELSLEDIYGRLAEEIEQREQELWPLRQLFNLQLRSLMVCCPGDRQIPILADRDTAVGEESLDLLASTLEQHFLVGFQACYAQSVRMFANEFGWHALPEVHANPTSARPKADDISTELRQLIEHHNRLDIALYNRMWEKFGERNLAAA
jgi:hypothetical protein